MDTIVVVGASLGGLRTVETLRRKGFEGRLILVGEEPHQPYDRPPLSKMILTGDWEPAQTTLRWKGAEALNVEMRLGERAIALHADAREVELEGGERLGYDGLVIATGCRARRLEMASGLSGVHVIRSLDDAMQVRRELEKKPKVVVIGAGYIGAEVAASCTKIGLPVTVLESLPVPLARGLGEKLGAVVAEMHRKRGVDMRCGVKVERLEGEGAIERVILEGGESVDCDLLIVAIGAEPVTDWLEGSGLALDNGVVCDSSLRASLPGVVAVGDVCSWQNPLFDERMRIEHWTNAVEQAKHAAVTLLAAEGEENVFESAPLFWSDQYEGKIQGAGRPRPDDTIHICHGTLEEEKFVALYGRGSRLVGVVAFAQPAKVFQYRAMIAKRASWAEAMELAVS